MISRACIGDIMAGERHDLYPSETMSYCVKELERELFIVMNSLNLTGILWFTFF